MFGWNWVLSGLTEAHGRAVRRRDELVDRALSRRLVWPPLKKLSPVAEPIAGYIVVSDFDDLAERPTRRRLQGGKLSD